MFRPHRVLLVVAAFIVVFGFVLLDASRNPGPSSVRGEETFQIPDGREWHSFFELEMLGGGSVFVEFEETSEGLVTLYLFNQGDYATYQETGLIPPAVGSMSGSSGIFIVGIPSDGTYYLVFEHGEGYEALPQDVQVSYVFAGISPTGPDRTVARTGFVLVMFGAVVGNVGGALHFRRKRRGSGRTTDRKIADIVPPEELPPPP